MSGDRISGSVKWFNNSKGYGFIALDTGQEVFVHYSAIRGSGYKSLDEGERVELSVENDSKGPRASDVVRLNPRPPKPRQSGSGEAQY